MRSFSFLGVSLIRASKLTEPTIYCHLLASNRRADLSCGAIFIEIVNVGIVGGLWTRSSEKDSIKLNSANIPSFATPSL